MQRDCPSQHKGNETRFRSQAYGWDYADRFFPTNFLCNTNTTVRQTLHPRGQHSTGNKCGGTFTGRDSRGRYSRHAEGDSKFITDFRDFYANPVRPLQTGLFYVLRGTDAREAQVKWAKLTVYQILAVGYITPKAVYAIHCFIHVLSSADACRGGAAL